MNEYYQDIIDKISESPKWFDEHAVPRYCEFSPKRLANIYATESALVLIACQDCGKQFEVAFSQAPSLFANKKMSTLADAIKDKTLHYGDPPNIHCCPAGPTMNCVDIKVLEYWERKTDIFKWKRDKSLEVDLEGEVINAVWNN